MEAEAQKSRRRRPPVARSPLRAPSVRGLFFAWFRGLGFGVQGLGFIEFRIYGLEFRVYRVLGSRIKGLGLGGKGLGSSLYG